MTDTITYSQVKSSIGSRDSVRATLAGLGLIKMHRKVTRKNTQELRGMLSKVQHLVKLEV